MYSLHRIREIKRRGIKVFWDVIDELYPIDSPETINFSVIYLNFSLTCLDFNKLNSFLIFCEKYLNKSLKYYNNVIKSNKTFNSTIFNYHFLDRKITNYSHNSYILVKFLNILNNFPNLYNYKLYLRSRIYFLISRNKIKEFSKEQSLQEQSLQEQCLKENILNFNVLSFYTNLYLSFCEYPKLKYLHALSPEECYNLIQLIPLNNIEFWKESI